VNRGRRPIEHRNHVAPILAVAIRIGHEWTEKAVRLSANLVGGAVIDAQSARASPDIYARGPDLARARELLTRTDLSLSEVAVAVGFADQSHFTRRFRQMVGVSPEQFRKVQRTTSIVASTSVSGASCG
jgi:methylphosphotriester-DNA--protein-cysteine methyltransferase